MSDPAKPVIPAIPVGLGTFIGLGTGAGQWAAAIIAAANGDHSITTITLIVTGAATVITTLVGRFAQAHALAKKVGGVTVSNVQPLQPFNFTGGAPLSSGTTGALALDDEELHPFEAALGRTDPAEDLEVDDPAQVPEDEGDDDAAENIS